MKLVIAPETGTSIPKAHLRKTANGSAASANGAAEPIEEQPELRVDQLPKPIRQPKSTARVRLVLDEGQTTDVLGICYGIEHEIAGAGYRVKVMLDNYNRRIKVIDYRAQDYAALVAKLDFLASANNFDKIWIKGSDRDWERFLRHGYVLEGLLKWARRGRTAYMLSKFRSQKRMNSPALMKETLLIEEITARKRGKPKPLPQDYSLDYARESDLDGMLALYKRVFSTYPSPLTYREYLTAVLHRDAIFRVIRNEKGAVVAAASAELDQAQLAAELTDCATHPDQRGKGLMSVLLQALEGDLRGMGYVCSFTLARARSFGMNAAFHALGYEFNGRMINNCDIYGAFEDMNLWVKDLRVKGRPRQSDA